MSQSYKYFAFISYSRKDSKTAAWLQKRVEWFRFPVKLVPEDRRPPNPKYVRPVYRDKTNLEVTDEHYWTNIRRALDESRFLIVLCSPNSARSEPVNMELKHFLEVHGGDTSRIVPVIIGGNVLSTGADAALCPALRELGDELINRNLPTMVPDADIAEQDAWESGFVALSSYMLQLERTAIGDHIQRESRKQARSLRLWLGAVTALAVVAVLAGWMALQQRNLAEVARQDAENKLERSVLSEGKSIIEQAKSAKALGEVHTARILAGRAIGFDGVGKPKTDYADFERKYPPVLGKSFTTSPQLELERQEAIQAVQSLVQETHPSLRPIWSSPLSSQHYGFIPAIAMEPAGDFVASGDANGVVRVWDAKKGARIREILPSENGRVRGLRFSPSGKWLAIANEDGGNLHVRLWDVNQERVEKEFHIWEPSSYAEGINGIAFNQAEDKLAVGFRSSKVKVWDIETSVEKTLQADEDASGSVLGLAWQEDSAHLIVAYSAGVLKSWDAFTETELSSTSLESPGSSLNGIAVDNDFLTSRSDNTLTIWDIKSGKIFSRIAVEISSVGSALSHDGKWLANAVKGGEIKLLDVGTGKVIETYRGHGSDVYLLDFSKDGTQLCSASRDNTLRFWKVGKGDQDQALQGHSGAVNSVAISPDGLLVASAGEDRHIKIWNLALGEEVAELNGHTDAVTSVAFGEDGWIYSGSRDGTLRVWNPETFKQQSTLARFEVSVGAFDVSLSHKRIVCSLTDGTVKVLEFPSGKLLFEVKAHSGTLDRNDVKCHPSLPLFASAGSNISDGKVKVWDLKTGKLETEWNSHQSGACGISFSFDGKLLLSVGRDKRTCIWELETRKRTAQSQPTENELWCVACTPQNHWITGSKGGYLKAWVNIPPQNIKVSESDVQAVAVSPEGHRMVSGMSDGTVRVWDIAKYPEEMTVNSHGASQATDVDFHPDGTMLATSGKDGRVRLWDRLTGLELATFGDGTRWYWGVTFSPDGKVFAASNGPEIKVWETKSGRLVQTLQGHNAWMGSKVMFSHDGKTLASFTPDKSLRLWDLTTGVETWQQSVDECESIAFHPRDNFLLVGSDTGVHALDIDQGKVVRTLNGAGDVDVVAFDVTGTLVASGSLQGAVNVWSFSTGELKLQLLVEDSVSNLAFSPDQKHIAVGLGHDPGSIKLFDMKSEREVKTLRGHTSSISGLAYSQDGRMLATTAIDGTLRLWKMEDEEVDLLYFERGQEFMKNGEWSLNRTIGRAYTIKPDLRTSPDLESWLKFENDADRLLWRLHALGRAKNWRAALRLWRVMSREKNDAIQDVRVQRYFLAFMLERIKSFSEGERGGNIEQLINQFPGLFDKKVFEDRLLLNSFSGLAADMLMENNQAFGKMVSVGFVQEQVEAREAIAEALNQRVNGATLMEDVMTNLLTTLQKWQESHTQSFVLMRSYQRVLGADQPMWKEITEKVLSHPLASAIDFSLSCQRAGGQEKLKSDAMRWMNEAEKRYPTDRWLLEQAGWFYFFRSENADPSRRAFEKYLGTFEESEVAVDVDVDLAIMNWLTGKKDEAIQAFRRLFNVEKPKLKQSDQTPDWTDPQTIKSMNWGGWQTQIYNELRAETLLRFPELVEDRKKKESK